MKYVAAGIIRICGRHGGYVGRIKVKSWPRAGVEDLQIPNKIYPAKDKMQTHSRHLISGKKNQYSRCYLKAFYKY